METLLPLLRDAGCGLALAMALAEVAGRSWRGLPLLAASPVVGWMAWRGWQIGFLPLTNKLESFLGFAIALLGVCAFRYRHLGRGGRALIAVLAAVFLAATHFFDTALQYPTPLLYTRWYLVHVPVSFLGYAFWIVAAGDGLDHLLGATGSGEMRRRSHANVQTGLLWFSLAMVMGGIWGLVSWGAWFLWDPKIVWSVLAWFYFATIVHVPHGPFRPARVRASLGIAGLLIVLITYVGTSFMPGIHAFG